MFARTERLLLRPGWAEDAPALAAAIADPLIVRNLSSAPWPYGPDDARDFLRGWEAGPIPRFLMTRRGGAHAPIIGCIGLDVMNDGTHELGYWVARPFWGHGFASEAGAHMLRLARALGVGTVHASHFTDNPASGAVLRKLGFAPTGTITRRHSRGRGGSAPTVDYVWHADGRHALAGVADADMAADMVVAAPRAFGRAA